MSKIELYEIYEVEDEENNKFFCLYEKNTEQVHSFYLFEDEAREKKNFFESGGGFVGHTPRFLLREVQTKKNVNEEFSRLMEEWGGFE